MALYGNTNPSGNTSYMTGNQQGIKLPFGFSPKRAVQQIGSYVNPTGGTADYDVFSDRYVPDGPRDPNFGGVGESFPFPTDGTVAGTTSGTTSTTDPYAKWGGIDAYNNLVAGFDAQKQGIFGSAGDATDAASRGYNSSILDFLEQYRTGQGRIDQSGVNNELARRQGNTSILDMVGRGVRSGGVTLANRNASDSSAAGAIARAYGELGNREMRHIGNQYELGNRDLATQQEELVGQGNTFSRKYEEGKLETANLIATEARNKLGELDARMLAADMPGRIALEQEKQRIKSEAIAKLSQYDQLLSTERGNIKATDTGERQRQAAELQNRGTDLGDKAFDFTDQAPAQYQNTGDFASDLPIFTAQRRRLA